MTLQLVDPSISLTTPVSFIWQFNRTDDLKNNIFIWDIVQIGHGEVRTENSHIQLVGLEDITSVTIFHRLTNILTGWPSEPLAIRPFDEIIKSSIQNAETHKQRPPYLDAAWEIMNLGVANADAVARLDEEQRRQLPLPSAHRLARLWPSEADYLCELHFWADRHLLSESLASYSSSMRPVTLHAVLKYLNHTSNFQAYDNARPAAELHSADHNPAVPMQGGANNKCDLVCLVMSVLPASDDGPARMIVWDGTTNGMYAADSATSQCVHIGIQSCQIYDDCFRNVPSRSCSSSTQGATSSTSADLGAKFSALFCEDFTRQPSFVGCGVQIVASQALASHAIMQCRPGMYIKICNLNVQDEIHMGHIYLDNDSYVFMLSPRYL